MHPLFFDGCFGWLHMPPPHRATGHGVVLCQPHGNDDICTHREWIDLADLLANTGMAVLRFDTRGSGDAIDLPQAGPVEWLADIRAATACLRKTAQVGPVALCGLRLGSVLAFQAARDIPDISALVLLAPPASGRAWVRELRVAASGSNLAVLDPPPAPDSTLPLNSNGFLWPAATLQAIETLEIAPPSPVARILILQAQSTRRTEAMIQALRQNDVQVEQDIFPDLKAFLNVPLTKSTPVAAFEHVAQWLSHLPGTAHLPIVSPAMPICGLLEQDGYQETPLCFGPQHRLFGMLARPPHPAPTPQPTIVMVNTGTSHHIGNGRMLVELARTLARQGVASFRMDIAGMGDSPGSPEQSLNPLYGPDGPIDVQAALDALTELGLSHFVILGLCAGAYLGLQSALRDPRITAVAAINLQVFVWETGQSLEIAARKAKRSLHSYLKSLSNPGEWRRILKADVDFLGIALALTQRGIRRIVHTLIPPRPGSPIWRSRAWVRQLQARGVWIWFLYSADDPGLGMFSASFGKNGQRLRPFSPQLRVETLPRADHNLNASHARTTFMTHFIDWIARLPSHDNAT